MKVSFKHAIMAFAALTLGLTSCSNDDDVTGGGDVDNGTPTQMTISINFPKSTAPQVRATADPNASDAEAAVKTVDVFIYNASGVFMSHEALTASDFTASTASGTADKYTYSKATKISTTTGQKNIFVGINLPSGVATSLVNQSMGKLATAAQTLTRAQLTTIANGLPMFSSTPATSTFVADDTDPANNVTVTVERLVAKVTVEADASMVVAGVPGTLGDLKFAINNFNERMFLVQGAGPDFKDPNWDSQGLTTFNASEFSDAATTEYVSILDRRTFVGTPGVADYAACYASENTSKEKLKGEITRATVRATFIPADMVKSDGAGGYTETTTAAEGITVPATFYAYTESVGAGTKYFYTKAVADSYAVSKGGTAADVLEYVDGYCYWDMFLNKTTTGTGVKWDVLRNEYFKCNITRIVAPGKPTIDVVPPTVTPDDETKITVNIDVLFWNTPVLANYVLE